MKTLTLSLILIVLLVTACGSRKEPTPTPANTDTPPPPTATPILQPPDGTYVVNITKEELTNAGLTEAEACENAGRFSLTLTGTRWNILQAPLAGCTVLNPKWGGSMKFSADQITFHDDEPFGCDADYTYQWQFSGGALRLTSVDDSTCKYRVYYMSQHPWIKVK